MNNINDSDISILGFLITEPMHGYELHKKVTDLSGFGIVWNIKIGKLYAMLNRLEKDGLIKSAISKGGNRPARNEFSITSRGKKKFESWMVSPINHGREFRIVFLLKLYFSMKFGLQNTDELINTQIEICKSWLSERSDISQNEMAKESSIRFPLIVKKYRLIQINGYIDWLNWCQDFIQEKMK